MHCAAFCPRQFVQAPTATQRCSGTKSRQSCNKLARLTEPIKFCVVAVHAYDVSSPPQDAQLAAGVFAVSRFEQPQHAPLVDVISPPHSHTIATKLPECQRADDLKYCLPALMQALCMSYTWTTSTHLPVVMAIASASPLHEIRSYR